MTVEDFKSLLALISSDRLALRGHEVQTIAALQVKLANTIKAAETPSGDSPRPTE